MSDRHELVFALCHEIANLLAGVRLEAGLLGDRPDAGDLPRAAPRISEASARAGSLLAMVRPLLEPGSLRPIATDPLELLEGLRSGLDESCDARVAIALKSAAAIPPVVLAPDAVHHLLLTAIFAGLEADKAGGRVRISCAGEPGRVAFVVEDAGAAFELDPEDALRGRPLTLAVAESVLGEMAGRVRVSRVGDRTHVAFDFPADSG